MLSEKERIFLSYVKKEKKLTVYSGKLQYNADTKYGTVSTRLRKQAYTKIYKQGLLFYKFTTSTKISLHDPTHEPNPSS